MTTFSGYKGRIERADSMEALSRLAAQIKADTHLSGKDRLMLDTYMVTRVKYFGELSRMG